MTKLGKAEYRKIAKEIRASVDIKVISRQIVNNIKNWQRYKEAKDILTYWAFGSEIDLSELNNDNKNFYLSRTPNISSLGLSIHSMDSELEQHKYGYWQPLAGSAIVAPEQIDLVLVPALAFDELGNRLGYGKGYYDRLLAKMPQAEFLGVSARALIFKNLPSTSFDIPMDYIVSEDGLINTKTN